MRRTDGRALTARLLAAPLATQLLRYTNTKACLVSIAMKRQAAKRYACPGSQVLCKLRDARPALPNADPQQPMSHLCVRKFSGPATALVDGNSPPDLACEVRTIVKGDSRSMSIAAASIVAKVTRDNIMTDLSAKHPGYGWERNAGYGTKEHQNALLQFGVTSAHRQSFAPIRKLLTTSSE